MTPNFAISNVDLEFRIISELTKTPNMINSNSRLASSVDGSCIAMLYIYIELVLVCEIQKSAQCHIDRAKCIS